MDILDVFKELGLKEDHLKIYQASLSWGETTISNLAYKSKIPRTTAYDLVSDLIKVGLIKLSVKNDSKVYIPEDPEKITELLKNKSSEISNLISVVNNSMKELKAIQNTKKNKPKIYLLEGAEGIKQAYEMTFNTKEVLVQCLTDDYGDVSEDWFNDYFERFFLKSDVKSKEILRENEDTEYIKRYGSKKNLQLRVPVQGEIETDFMVMDDKVVFVSFEKGGSYALVIQDSKISSAMRNLYNRAWESAIRKDKRIKSGEKVLTEYEE
jgi:sugar-specific transcriptional regulator TrmB